MDGRKNFNFNAAYSVEYNGGKKSNLSVKDDRGCTLWLAAVRPKSYFIIFQPGSVQLNSPK